MPSSSSRPERIHWFARLEHRFHAWRERRARKRGRTATIVPFPGYGGPGWVRVVGRVLILPKTRRGGRDASVRGWRSFVGIPVSFATVTITVAGRAHEVAADRGGVVDCRIDADLPSGWQEVTMTVEGQDPIPARAQAQTDPMGGVALFARCVPIGLEDGVDEGDHRIETGMRTGFTRLLVRDRAPNCLAHHAPMHPELARDALNRPHAKLVFPANCFE